MIKQAAKVIAIDDQNYTLETLPQAACPRCEAGKGCGGGILAKAFGSKIYQIEIPKDFQSENLNLNELLVIGISESTLVFASMLHYLLPLVMMIVGAGVSGAIFGTSDINTIIGALMGFSMGLFVSRTIADKQFNKKIHNPTILRDDSQCYYSAYSVASMDE